MLDQLGEADPTDPAARAAATTQRTLARLLVPLNYARGGRFAQDPAETIKPLPDLAAGLVVCTLPADSHQYQAALVTLRRALNRVRWTLWQATNAVRNGNAGLVA
jgi:hypothetical protein